MDFANDEGLADLRNNKSEYVNISKIIFNCFDSFSQKSEQIGKFKIDEWAQIQTKAGHNAITIVFPWTSQLNLNVSFPIFNNFVFLSVFDWKI